MISLNFDDHLQEIHMPSVTNPFHFQQNILLQVVILIDLYVNFSGIWLIFATRIRFRKTVPGGLNVTDPDPKHCISANANIQINRTRSRMHITQTAICLYLFLSSLSLINQIHRNN